MATKLIKLEDNILIEVEIQDSQSEQIAGGFIEKVKSSFEKIEPVLLAVCRPITGVWHEIEKNMDVEKATVEIGLSFEVEGNVYVTKSTTNANLKLTFEMKPKIAKNLIA